MRFIPSHPEHGDALRLGYEFTNKLAAVMHAHIVGDEDSVDLLLSDVDGGEARRVSVLLHDLFVGYTFAPEVRGGSTGAPVDDSTAVPLPSDQATAPTFPGHSVKA